MRVGIDARWIFPTITGIGSYTQELLRHIPLVTQDLSVVLLFQDTSVRDRTLQYIQDGGGAVGMFETVMVPYGLFSPANQVRLPGLIRQLQLDVFHSPNYMIPFRAFPRGRPGRTACVVTIHDLIPLLFPEHTPKALKTRLHPLFRWIMREVGARADKIITVSESSRQDILAHMAIRPDRAAHVIAIHEGVAARYCPLETHPPHPTATVLYVGRMDPYKNVTALVRAFRDARRHAVRPLRLNIIGPRDPRYPEVEQLIASEGLSEYIDWPGYVSGEELLRAYRDATVFVLPSLYEGFGLPVLEAMASGTPVICSNRASLPEVAGDAALIVDPDQPDELANAIRRVCDDPALANDLRTRGRVRAARFTWQDTAQQTIELYRNSK